MPSRHERYGWEPGDPVPDWLSLTPDHQRAALIRLLETAPRSGEEHAHRMLLAPPFPFDEADAQARVAAVIRYLSGGYRVGDRHPATESKEAG